MSGGLTPVSVTRENICLNPDTAKCLSDIKRPDTSLCLSLARKMSATIFVQCILKMILDRLLYEDYYPDIESAMSSSNISARKNKNSNNHLFIIYGIINSVIHGEDDATQQLQIYKSTM